MKKIIVLSSLFLSFSAAADARLRVAAASPTLADIAAAVAGDLAVVESLSDKGQDLHAVEPRPSMVVKLKRADLAVKAGMDLDSWMDSLINAARNRNIFYGAPGYVDASIGIDALEKPAGKVDASMGDIHVFGNPHYWLDPLNGKIIAKNIADGLSRVSPENAPLFRANYEKFCSGIDAGLARWMKDMEPLRGKKAVTYHGSWPYFFHRFGLELEGTIEPKPGIPPSASHLEGLMAGMKAHGVNFIMSETFYPRRPAGKITARTGARLALLPSGVGEDAYCGSYAALFDRIVALLTDTK